MANSGARKLGGRARVAVVDDDADTRQFLKDIFQFANNFTFAGEFSSGIEALKAIPSLHLDLALIDIRLPDMDGVECTKRLKCLVPDLKVVMFSGNRDPGSFERSLAAGAATYIIKPVDPDQLLATLQFVAVPTNEEFNVQPARSEANTSVNLSPREKAVLGKLAEGLLYKEISSALGISYTAVRKSQHRIFRKLHVCNRSEATRAWLQSGGNC